MRRWTAISACPTAEVEAGEQYLERIAQSLRDQGVTVETAIFHSNSPTKQIVRYTFVERCVHWFVAGTFIALMVSGFALGYPRAAFLSGLFVWLL